MVAKTDVNNIKVEKNGAMFKVKIVINMRRKIAKMLAPHNGLINVKV